MSELGLEPGPQRRKPGALATRPNVCLQLISSFILYIPDSTSLVKHLLSTWLSTNLNCCTAPSRTSFEGKTKLFPPCASFVPSKSLGLCLLRTSDIEAVSMKLGCSPTTFLFRRLTPTLLTSLTEDSATSML